MKKIIVGFLSIIYSLTVYGQYQYYNSRLNINPAFTGSDSTLVISSNCRVQLIDLGDGNDVLIDFSHHSVDTYIRAIRGGLGFNYAYSKFYYDSQTIIDFNYAPHFELFKHKIVLQPAIQVSYLENKIGAGATFISPNGSSSPGPDEVSYMGEMKKSNVDLSAGLLLFSKKIVGGIAIYHLTEPDMGIMGSSKLPIEITIHGGAKLKFKKDSIGKFILSPNFLMEIREKDVGMMPGIVAKYKFISLGLSYIVLGTLITTIAFQNKSIRVAYSYLSNKYLLFPSGIHEIGLNIFLKSKKMHCKIKTLRLI